MFTVRFLLSSDDTLPALKFRALWRQERELLTRADAISMLKGEDNALNTSRRCNQDQTPH
jgi:hypothetical protein